MAAADGGPGSADGGPAEPGHGDGAAGAGGENGERLGGQADLLHEMKALRRQARTARHAYWFPLVVFGLVVAASVPFYIQPAWKQIAPGQYVLANPDASSASWLPSLGGSPGMVQNGLAYYWVAGLLAGLSVTQLFYRWHARRVGLQTPARGYLITTVIITLLAVVVPLLTRIRHPHWLSFLQWLAFLQPGDLLIRGTFPLVIIGIGLLVLARAERSRALGIIAAVYTAVALVASLYDVSNLTWRLGWNFPQADEGLPNVLLAAVVLLLAGAGSGGVALLRRYRTAV